MSWHLASWVGLSRAASTQKGTFVTDGVLGDASSSSPSRGATGSGLRISRSRQTVRGVCGATVRRVEPLAMSSKSPIELRSDNAAGAAPEIVAAAAAANQGSALAYGGDEWTRTLTGLVRDVFEHDVAAVFPVASGTAANALALSALTPPWGAVLCHETAHIIQNEGGATRCSRGAP